MDAETGKHSLSLQFYAATGYCCVLLFPAKKLLLVCMVNYKEKTKL